MDRPPRRAWRLTPEGRYWLLLVALLLLLGLLKMINLLALLACCLLAVALLSAVTAGRGLRRLQARRRLVEQPIAGRPCALEVEVGNTGRFAVVGVRLEDNGPAHSLAWFAPRLEPGASVTFRGTVRLPRRGRYTWGSVQAARGHPFGLVERRHTVSSEGEVLVWPWTGTLDRAGFRRHLLGALSPRHCPRDRPRPHPTAQAEFYGLRAWRPGDTPRSIHWRSTARRGELMVRECEEPTGDDLIVILDPTSTSKEPEAFEEAVRLAATICREWCRRPDGRLVLLAAGPGPDVLSGPTGVALERRLLDRLALSPEGTDAVGALTGVLNRVRLPAAPAVLIQADSGGVLEDLARRSLKRPPAVLDPATATRLGFYHPGRHA